jgi:hypothetical protein
MYGLTTGADGRVYFAWVEPLASGGHVLKFSRLEDDRWQAPREVARGANWFVNWADHPSLTALADGSLVAHWLVHTGRKQGAYGYGIQVARSNDQGVTWHKGFEDGMRNVADYSGFLTFAPGAAGDAVYLTPVAPDEGKGGPGHAEHIKTLAAVSIGADGAVSGQRVIDEDVCSCCPTDIARTADGLVAVYRDHLAGEIRDISIVRFAHGRWSEPRAVHRDGWQIAACPTNGPAVAARGRLVVVAWFTAAGDTPRAKVAFSTDGGATFASPTTVDEGRPVGWVDVALLDDGSAAVSWLENRGEGTGELLVRRVSADAPPRPAVSVARASSGRATGVPQMIRLGDRLIVVWRHERVMTAAVSIAALDPSSSRPE